MAEADIVFPNPSDWQSWR